MTPYYSDDWLTMYGGDCLDVMREMPADSVDCVVTSPPYWGLRDYGTATWEGGDAECDHKGKPIPTSVGFNERYFGRPSSEGNKQDDMRREVFHDTCGKCGATRIDSQLGLERTPEEYVANMVNVFREVRRVLKPTGTCFLNLGDSYASSGPRKSGRNDTSRMYGQNGGAQTGLKPRAAGGSGPSRSPSPERAPAYGSDGTTIASPKPKDLVGIPWRVAFALQQPFYTGRIKDEKDRIWLAAMIDGEGCLFIHKRKVGQNNGQGYARKSDSYGSGMEIANTSEAIVRRCMEITGKGSIVRQEKDRRQPLYRWNLRSNECREVVREVYEHLVAKKHQARLLIGCPSSGPKAEAAHQALMDLHNGIPTDVDFPAPESMWEPGWYLRSDVVWSKSNPMPESVTDRPTKSHEMVFLLTKQPRYYFDADAVREPHTYGENGGAFSRKYREAQLEAQAGSLNVERTMNPAGRNIRSVWTIATRPYPGAHFAVFPPELPERCIKAGSSEKGVCPECGAPWERTTERGDPVQQHWAPGTQEKAVAAKGKHGATSVIVTGMVRPKVATGWRPTCDPAACESARSVGFGVDGLEDPRDWGADHSPSVPPVPAVILDPFGGSGTVGMVANRLSRRAILIDLNPEYLEQQMKRNAQTPLGLDAA